MPGAQVFMEENVLKAINLQVWLSGLLRARRLLLLLLLLLLRFPVLSQPCLMSAAQRLGD